MKKLLFTFFAVTSLVAKAQVVSLFAGSVYTGDGAFSGATGSINKFQDSFSMPWAIAPDTNGRFWITDQHNLNLLIGSNSWAKGGSVLNPNEPGSADYADGTGTSKSRFANPAGCFVHPVTNRVYVCDADNNLIRYQQTSVINTNDQVAWGTFAGVHSFLGSYKDGALGVAEFASPQDIVITSTGVIYICDRDNHCIRKITGGQVSTIAGSGTNSGDVDGTGNVARFYAPTGICLIDDNTLLVADRNNGKIKKVDLTNGKVTTVVSTGLNAPSDIVYINGIIYIADSYAIRMWNGTSLTTYAGKVNVAGYAEGSDINARFSLIMHIAYHPKTKSIYVTDLGNNVFRQLTVIQPPQADFIAQRTNPTVNEVVTLTSTSLYTTGWTWAITPGSYTLQNGSKLTDSVMLVTFANTGSYTVELTATNPTGSNKKTKTNYINVSLIGGAKPNPDFKADATNAIIGQTVSFTDLTTDNPTSWAWVFTPNNVTYQNGTSATDRFPKVTFSSNGKYTVELTATNTNGSNKITKTDYINIGPLDVHHPEVLDLKVYPNPATDKIFVGNGLNNVIITGVDGKSHSLVVTDGTVNIETLSAGIYSVEASLKNGDKLAGRFIKTN
ncbi:MAG: PKD domain-containing protein [Bacteroidetes bacterium]|nr:PKD domain-containing protein [Bacteroidota bacterium]